MCLLFFFSDTNYLHWQFYSFVIFRIVSRNISTYVYNYSMIFEHVFPRFFPFWSTAQRLSVFFFLQSAHCENIMFLFYFIFFFSLVESSEKICLLFFLSLHIYIHKTVWLYIYIIDMYFSCSTCSICIFYIDLVFKISFLHLPYPFPLSPALTTNPPPTPLRPRPPTIHPPLLLVLVILLLLLVVFFVQERKKN